MIVISDALQSPIPSGINRDVVLKWLLDQWLEPVNHSIPIWKFVLMYYCLTLFSATVAFTVHFTWLKGETIFLLNSALQVERNVKSKGTDTVHLYYAWFVVLSKITVILMPAACTAIAIVRPCMPPAWSSVIYLKCESWDDDGNSGIIFRICGALPYYYLGMSLASTTVFVFTVVLIYPAEVKLILLESINRDLCRRWQNAVPCLHTYRTLQMLGDMHNSVFRHPIMAILIGAVTVCASFALYILITSTSVAPIPIIIILSLVALDLFIMVVGPFKFMANPLPKSTELLQSFKRMNRSRWIKRFVRSCPPSKLLLGDGKFFDRATSLVICRKSADLVITFLLM
ncbi:hypothetical protein Fcan01_11137 [Folsomia candida]|uniref:Uncharacterized protein n=1 Tax=Folsomia candida TaxID=158441 RepID=A0A226EAR7_FOLCA|nr:hypothetical protein Fcan01_11137 [Folsomia candida]